MTRTLIVEADGGSRGNPGVAGYGALVRDPASGEILARRAAPLGKASNNVAEYTGLIRGLEAAAKIAPGADVEVRMDSKLVIEQMAGRWKIKHEDMRRLALEARDLLPQLGTVTWTWIPREKNKDADALSNDGMDGKTIEEFVDAAPTATTDPADGGDEQKAAPQEPPAARTRPRPVRVLLVRHGVSAFTEEQRLDGRGGSDPSLSENGRRQAAATAQGVRAKVRPGTPVRVVASGLKRAQETAAVVADALGAEVEHDDAWDEQHYGDWNDHLLRDLVRDPDFERLRSDESFAVAGGETHVQVRDRVLDALGRLVGEAEPGSIVVVATHRKPIAVVLSDVLGLDLDTSWRLAVGPASLTGVELWPDGHATISFVNDTNHLR